MRIAYVAAGAAGMYCGSCLHDNTLAAALLARGHDVALLPTYTPLRTDEPDVSEEQVFYGAVNVYLEQRMPWFRRAPGFLHRLLDRPGLLDRVARLGASTDASELGPLTLSVLRGEEGRQVRELEELVAWLADYRPDVVQLTNSMFLGFARRIREVVGAPVVCGLSGEDIFLDDLVEPWRSRVLAELARRAGDADAFVAPSRYFAAAMAPTLGLAADDPRLRVVPLGIRTDDLGALPVRPPDADPVVIAYLARLCPEKGLGLLLEAFGRVAEVVGRERVRLVIGGWSGKERREWIEGLVAGIRERGLADTVELRGELDREGKLELLAGADILSVPSLYREAKGLYVLEALAAGVPVVEPRHGAFPEMIEATGGGVLVEPDDPVDLARGLERLVIDGERRRELGDRGRRAVMERFGADAMAAATEEVYADVVAAGSGSRRVGA